MFTKSVRAFLAIAFALTTLVSTTPVIAKPGVGCSLEISPAEGTVPLEINYQVVTSLPGDPMIIFGDNKPNEIGSTGKHTYDAVGGFFPKAVMPSNGSGATTCRSYVLVRPNSSSPVPTPIPTLPTPPPVVPTVTPVPQTNSTYGTINGDQNIAPVVNGDHNTVEITIEQAATVTPVTTPVVVKTTPKSPFWQLIKSVLDFFVALPNSWRDWIIQNK